MFLIYDSEKRVSEEEKLEKQRKEEREKEIVENNRKILSEFIETKGKYRKSYKDTVYFDDDKKCFSYLDKSSELISVIDVNLGRDLTVLEGY